MVDLGNKQKLLVICGPTATGKTKLAVQVAKQCNGEVVSADSMQIYKQLDVGTAKVTEAEKEEIIHHMVDVLEPDAVFSVAEYVKQANCIIADIASRGKTPILCGGTGLYISSLVNGIEFAKEKVDINLRNKLRKEHALYGNEEMHRRLAAIDPDYAKNIHLNNTVRVMRALELYEQSGVTMTEQLKNSQKTPTKYQATIIYLTYKNRNILYERIDERVENMLQNGLLSEVEFVYENRFRFLTAAKAIGYKELFPFLKQEQTLEECVKKLKQASRNYAKRQMTWFNAMGEKHIIYLDEQNVEEETKNILENSQFL